MIVGIDSRNEKRTASRDAHPKIFAQEIVDALREIPGIKAADCIAPIHSASRADCFPAASSFLRIFHFWP